jgi:hypothetical protein
LFGAVEDGDVDDGDVAAPVLHLDTKLLMAVAGERRMGDLVGGADEAEE